VTGFCQLNIGQLSRNRFWGEDESAPRRSALCVSSLLWHGDALLLVDPCMPFERMDELIFNRSGRRADEVTALFFTHPHGDHVVDAARYDHADFYIAPDTQRDWANAPLTERLLPFPDDLLPGVRSIALPGHTAATAGLAFPWLGRRALIAGDAVMTHDFFLAGAGYFNSVDLTLAAETIRKIKTQFDFVIPGHDALIPL
jgi:glyoxylase-like metal-dependent hydrolase (beta-lactamase superfamily II)